MSNKLAIRQHEIPEDYLLAKVVRSLPSPEVFFEKLRQEMSALILDQLKEFGGLVTKPEDVKRAEIRTLKLINLGLENASNASHGENHAQKNFQLAAIIIESKPLSLIYAVGKKTFESGKNKTVLDAAKASEVEINGLWFRLISKSELEALQALSNLDLAKGTLKEHERMVGAVFNISKKLLLKSLLPINKDGLKAKHHWGSLKKGTYPIDCGIIDCFLLSLIIAGLHRDLDALTIDRHKYADVRLAQSLAVDDLRQDSTQREAFIAGSINYHRMIEDDARNRLNEVKVNPHRQLKFLADLLDLRIEEVAGFADLLYFEAADFDQQIPKIQQFFLQYFDEASKSLRLNFTDQLQSLVKDELVKTMQRIREEVRKFYSTIDNPDLDNKEVMAFWDQRVSIHHSFRETEQEVDKRAREIAIAKKEIAEVSPGRLLSYPFDQLLFATKNFIYWDREKKLVFCEGFNLNPLLLQENQAIGLLKLLRNISWGLSTGWNREITRDTSLGPTHLENPPEDAKEDWAGLIMKKTAWSLLHPSTINELWRFGSDQIRDLVFEHREEIKISVVSLKKYYVDEHPDARLVLFVLDKLIKEDKIKASHRNTWEDLLRMTKDMPAARLVVAQFYAESQKKS